MDLIRALLLDIESGGNHFDLGVPWWPTEPDTYHVSAEGLDGDALLYHLRLLESAGFIDRADWAPSWVAITRLSWAGHDFLDSVRDPEVWQKTKAGALAAGGWTMSLIRDLARGYLKQQIEQRTGIQL